MIITKSELMVKLSRIVEITDSSTMYNSGQVTCKNNRLWGINSKDTIFLSVPFDFDGYFSVDVKDLLKIISKCKTENLDISVENDYLVIGYDYTTVKLKNYPTHYPYMEFGTNLKETEEDLNNKFKLLTIPKIREDKYQWIAFDGNKVMTTNGALVNVITLNAKFNKFELDYDNLKLLSKYNWKEIELDSSRLVLVDDLGFNYAFKYSFEEHLPVKSINNLILENKVKTDTLSFEINDEFFKQLQLASYFSKGYNGAKVKLMFDENKLTISSHNDKGEFCAELSVDITNYKDVFDLFVDAELLSSYSDKIKKIYLVGVNFPVLQIVGDNSVHLLATMR
jgi:hypothetical protein